jgi:hypothetical protein
VTQLPDLVRAAYREAAETVRPETVRDLQLGPGRNAWAAPAGTQRRGPGAPQRPGRALVPLAAAASVAAIAVAATVVIPRLGGNAPGHHRPSHPPTRYHGPLSALPTFIVVNHADAGGPGTSKLLTIVTTATGHVDGHLNAPAGEYLDAVAGTRGGRTFFAVAHQVGRSVQALFYKFSVSADGRPSALAPIQVRGIPTGGIPVALAATADGSRLAVSLDGEGQAGEIAIIDVASGTITRHWPHTLSEDYSTDLSISADGRLIAFTNYIGSGYSAVQVSRVMSTSAPSGPDTIVSRVLARDTSDAMLNTTGTVLYALARTPGQPAYEPGHVLLAYDVASGKLIRVIHRWPLRVIVGMAGAGPLSTDPAGGFALVPFLLSTKNAKACGLSAVTRKHHCVKYLIPTTGLASLNLATGALTTLPLTYPQFPSFGVFAW